MLALALDEMGRADRTIGLLPLGTMNILAREVGIHDMGSAVRALSSGRPRPVDLMRTSHPSMPIALTSLSVGFEGAFVRRYQSWRRFGRPAGAVMGMVAPRTLRCTLELAVDGRVIADPTDRAFSAGVYNAKHYPLGVVMARDADISDGVGESAVYLTEGAFWRTVAGGLRGGARAPGRHVRRVPWTTAVLETDGPIQADGEALDGARIEIRMERAGLHVLSPPTND
jgi:diacylglycerol kinase family enzyme